MKRMYEVLRMASALLLTLGPAARSQTAWKDAVDGTWDESAKWTSGVPVGNDASLGLTTASYTVSVTGAVANAFNSLTMANAGAFTTTLNIGNSGFRHGGGAISIGLGSTVHLTAGGTWSYPMGVTTPNPVLSIIDGGLVDIAGGSLTFTNLLNPAVLYVGRDGKPGSLTIRGGSLTFFSDAGGPQNANLTVGHGTDGSGTLTLTGGSLRTGSKNAGNQALSVAPHTRGTGSFVVDGAEWTSLGGSWNSIMIGGGTGSHGHMIITNNGVVSIGGNDRFYLGGGNLSTGSLHVASGTVSLSTFHVGASPGDGVTNRGQAYVTGGLMTNIWGANIGRVDNTTGSGNGLLEISGGTVRMSRYGLFIGRGGGGGQAHGEVTLSDGILDVVSTYAVDYGVANRWPLVGVSVGGVGHGPWAENLNANGRGYGRLEISGGTLNNSGNFVVGWNGGTGVVEQSSGVVSSTANASQYTTIIGYGFGTDSVTGHGVGTYRMSGGTYDARARVFVGGVAPERPYTTTTTNWFTVYGAEGRLEVSGGTFTTTAADGLYVGDYGTGTVVVGKSGLIQAPKVYLDDEDATLRFEFEDGEIGKLAVAGELTVGANAKLEIDARGATPRVKYTLVQCGSRSANFKANNITVLGAHPDCVDQDTDQNIYFYVPAGTLITVR